MNNVGNWEGGGGVKDWSKLTIDSNKTMPTWGRGVSKIQKNADIVYGWSLIYILLDYCFKELIIKYMKVNLRSCGT